MESTGSGASAADARGADRCVICFQGTRRLFMRHGYWILSCKGCGHRQTEIRLSRDQVDRIYDDHYFSGGGDGYPNYLSEAAILRRHGQYYGRLLSTYMPAGTALDVGAAAGFILQGLQDAGWKGTGLEPNKDMVERATELGLEVHRGTLEEFESADRFDLITMIQVVPHFAEVRKALEVAATITAPSGFWLIETWNRDSLVARLLGKQWHEYSPPSTINYFSPSGLRALAAQFGFRQVASGRPQKRISGLHAKSLLKYKLDHSPLERIFPAVAACFPDRLSIPYPAVDLTWSLFQSS
jgi:SAM-dependent methyltransferase